MATETTEQAAIRKAFEVAVNMSSAALHKWLDSEESKQVGRLGNDDKVDVGGGGQRSGKLILAVKRKNTTKLTFADYAHMDRVVACINRLLAQVPDEDQDHRRWRHSLMNWGHDPLG